MKKIILLSTIALMLCQVIPGMAQQISRQEAASIAKTWYAMELNSGYLKISDSMKNIRLHNIEDISIQHLISADELSPMASTMNTMAYIVCFKPSGYVVLAANERIPAVVAFDVNAVFRWDQQEDNFMRYWLGKKMTEHYKYPAPTPHPLWEKIRTKTGIDYSIVEFDKPRNPDIYVLWETANWGQGNHYNETVAENNGWNYAIPTGCTATAMAIKMRFHEWPSWGSGSNSYNDVWGSVKYSHSINFSTHHYYWYMMPAQTLTSDNSYVADLMYDCGVAVEMDYEEGGSGAWPEASAMNNFFGYTGSIDKWNSHDAAMIESIRAGLPVITSSSSHTVVADGYRDTQYPYIHVNCGWNAGSNGWYDLSTNFPGGDPSIDYSMPYTQPSTFTYVDNSHSGTENGKLQTPYNTIDEGVTNVTSGGELWIRAGTYTGTSHTGVIDKAMEIKPYQGTVIIE